MKKKIIIAAVIATTLCVSLAILLPTVIIPSVKYRSAVKLSESENYDAAIEVFTALGDYKDSKEQITYNEALSLCHNGEYEVAIAKFKELSDYKDSKEKIVECEISIKDAEYNAALLLYNSGKYEEAISAFQKLNEYKDCKEQIEKCKIAIKDQNYNSALSLINAGRYDDAIIVFETLGDYKDSQNQVSKCQTAINDLKYNSAISLYNAGKYEEAISAFQKLDGYKDSVAQIEKCKTAIEKANQQAYNVALSLYNRGKYEDALTAFLALGNYKDSEAQVMKCHNAINEELYNDAKTLLENGKVIEAYNAFAALGDYKSSAQKVKEIEKSAAYKIAKMKDAPVGSYVSFGSYEQDNNSTNGAEEIEWLVLAKENNRILVVSKYALDCQSYGTNNSGGVVSWSTCFLRAWLNDTFYKKAFTTDERRRILGVETLSEKKDWKGTSEDKSNCYVFLLSLSEVNAYLGSYNAKKCSPTAYAIAHGALDNESSGGWWLRSTGRTPDYTLHTFYRKEPISGTYYPGEYGPSYVAVPYQEPSYRTNYAALINYNGNIDTNGKDVSSKTYGVRPAIWIDVSN